MVQLFVRLYCRHPILFEAGDEDVTRATIIIGDGKDSSRRRLKEMLTHAGYLVEAESTNAPDLLRKTRNMFPDLVIMDSGLEGGSVAEIVGIIEGDAISNVLVLGQGNKAWIPEDIAQIQKPYAEETLLSVIEVILIYQNRLATSRQELTALKESLQSRKSIEQAKGILMKQLGIDEAEAYRTMQKESMNRSISMKDLARAIIIAYKDNLS
jgi:response regulator NasT